MKPIKILLLGLFSMAAHSQTIPIDENSIYKYYMVVRTPDLPMISRPPKQGDWVTNTPILIMDNRFESEREAVRYIAERGDTSCGYIIMSYYERR